MLFHWYKTKSAHPSPALVLEMVIMSSRQTINFPPTVKSLQLIDILSESLMACGMKVIISDRVMMKKQTND